MKPTPTKALECELNIVYRHEAWRGAMNGSNKTSPEKGLIYHQQHW